MGQVAGAKTVSPTDSKPPPSEIHKGLMASLSKHAVEVSGIKGAEVSGIKGAEVSGINGDGS